MCVWRREQAHLLLERSKQNKVFFPIKWLELIVIIIFINFIEVMDQILKSTSTYVLMNTFKLTKTIKIITNMQLKLI